MASKMIKGITIEIGGNTTKLGQAIDNSEKKTRSLQAELRQVERLLKFDPSNVELLNQKQTILTQSIEETSARLEILKKSQEQVNEQYKKGEIGEEQLRAFQREITKTENSLNSMQKELNETNKSISLIGENDGIKKNTKSIEEATNELNELGNSAKETVNKVAVGAGAIGVAVATGMGYALKITTDFDKALNTLATRTGATKQQMDQLDESMTKVYKNNFGNSIQDVAESMATVRANTKLMGEGLEEATEYALLMRDTFEFDVNESSRTAKMLMDQFGLSAKSAYSLIAQGAQNGLDKNGDLLDTINEYAVHYKQLGLTAEEFFNSLINGSQNGTFSVDKLGDAYKEFGIRVKDTAESTTEGFELLNLNADEMRKKFAKGGEVAKKATQETVTALFALNDEVKRNQAGVDLFGTMWEDLGEDAIKSLMNVNGAVSTTSKALENINDQKYDDLGNQLQELGRTIEADVAVPIGEELKPVVEDAIGFVKENAPQIKELITNIAYATGDLVGWLIDNSDAVLTTIGGITAGFMAWKAYSVIDSIIVALQTYKTAQEAATLAQLAFNTALNASPVMMAVTALGFFAGAIGALTIKTAMEKDEHEKNMLAIEEETKKRDESLQKQREQIESGTGEISHLQNLNIELRSLVDENGKVKEGYENRVQFILSQLNPALGLELQLVDGQVQGYKELGDNINLLLEKKKAQIILEAQLPAYQEAVNNATEKQIEANKLNAEIVENNSKLKELENKLIKEYGENWKKSYSALSSSIGQQWSTLQADTIKKEQEYEKQNKLLKGYYDDITLYEINASKIQKGDMQSLMEVEQSVVTGKAQNNEERKRLLNDQLDAQKSFLSELERMYDESQDDEYLILIEGQKEKIRITEETINGMSQTVESGNEKTKTAYKNNSKAGVEGIKETKEDHKTAGAENADAYNEGVSSKKENSKKAGKDLADQDKEGKKSTKEDHKTAGAENANAYNEGVSSKKENSKKAGKDLADQDKEGKKSTKEDHKTAGAENAEAYKKGVDSKKETAKTAGSNLGLGTAGGIKGMVENALQAGLMFSGNIVQGINRSEENAKKAGLRLRNMGLQGYKSMANDFVNAGINSADGIKSGIDQRKGSLWSAMSGLGTSMLTAFKKSLDINSPSKKFKQAGINAVEGVALAIDENADMAIDSTQNMANGMLRTINGMQLDRSISASLSLDGVTSNIYDSQYALNEKVNTLINVVNEYLPYIAKNAGKDIYLDGELVSQSLVSTMDIKLAEIADLKSRGG
ncbi:phage tail tape measure protein [Thomasclavelia cocleata]|uniref:phage tail tape measure protein n=7 Tax=Thomasclavelia cocleata TaxID=69824 RepID=UPI0025711AA2|nr:phage tail tape measure protein [Thomasclavelia cocleata]